MKTTLLLVEKNFGEEPRHALILNETLIKEQVSDNVGELITLAENMSVALQARYSVIVCDKKSQYDALLKVPDTIIEP